MKKKEMREVVITYCDYCGAELTSMARSSIEYKDGTVKDFCSTYTNNTDVTCLDKYNKEERDRLYKSRAQE